MMDSAGVWVVEAKRGSEVTKVAEVKILHLDGGRARRALGVQTSFQTVRGGAVEMWK